MSDLLMIFMSFVWGALLTLPFLFITFALQTPAAMEKVFDKALKEGKTVVRTTAVLVRRYRAEDTLTKKWTTGGVYEYVHNGKKYKYRMHSRHLSSTIQLTFFSDHPRGATTGAVPSTKKRYRGIFIIFLVMSLLSYLVIIL